MTGLKCSMCPTCTRQPCCRAAASTRSASARLAQSGFSISRWVCFASSGRATRSCWSVGTTTEAASQASPSSSSVAKRRHLNFSQISFARASLVSKIPASSAPGSVE